MQSQYAAAANVPLIKSPALRVPPPVQLPPDIHPLPDSVTPYFVYPFTLESHVLALESSRRNTIAAHEARREALLRARDDERQRRKREALRRVAPGFEGNGAVLMPVRQPSAGRSVDGANNGHGQVGTVDDLVHQLARLDTQQRQPPRS
ncbi:hypothetical protein BKA82DRAFT_131262 [Pisolithus tinctorius]|uniref:Uncharacterized protein n=1 Tax=Pisolithus tinctorius Marx 270 TaxID=870435 RepID=A0A0C3PLV5_PISTI|nr:hypothetical protein BKA82DRAFT_131262 [Pisolithus tinctorius]KIO09746.1 hypothetical protein M404DRAFT_131262 [Pisolithus tinctorius Marx 270]